MFILHYVALYIHEFCHRYSMMKTLRLSISIHLCPVSESERSYHNGILGRILLMNRVLTSTVLLAERLMALQGLNGNTSCWTIQRLRTGNMMVAEVLSCVQQPKASPDAKALSGNVDRLTLP